MFYLLENQDAYHKLKQELSSALPDASSTPTFATVEGLPYLISLVFPGLRLLLN